MAEVTNEPIYEVLKAVRNEVAAVRDDVRGINVRLTSFSEQVRGLALEVHATNTDIANPYTRLDRMDGRLLHIDRRLEIAEAPAE